MPPRHRSKLLLLLGSAAVSLSLISFSACPSPGGPTSNGSSNNENGPKTEAHWPAVIPPLPEPDRVISIFFTGDLQGHIEPCGCTKDPLGGVDRLSGYIAQAKAQPRFAGGLLLDAGDLLFEKTSLEIDKEAQIDKAALITEIWASLGCAAALTGARDLPQGGPDLSSPPLNAIPRLIASDPEKRRLLKEVGGLSLGILGATSKESGAPAADDPIRAAKEDVEALKAQGAKVIIALAYGGAKFGRELAKKVPGVNFVIVSSGDPEHVVQPGQELTLQGELIESTGAVLLSPYSQGQSVGEIQLRLLGDDLSLEDGDRPERKKKDAERAHEKIKEMSSRIEEAKKTGADYSSLVEPLEKQETKKAEAVRAAEMPIQGSYFTTRLALLGSSVKKDESIDRRKEDFVVAQGEKFKARALTEILPEPKEKESGYVGSEECGGCHTEEYEVWKKTPHAHALETLKNPERKRDGLPECVECHVAGFRKPGGTTLVSRVEELGGVQCENCHGPGSRHVEALGHEKTSTVQPYPQESVCRSCHYPPHTDGFNFTERLPKILGPGHGREK